jgi:type 1 fimbriae regulatory protein FimB/type 1 fimbriae regulatory protein FimE
MSEKSPPPRKAKREDGVRKHLTPAEVERLIKSASKVGRHGHRDATMILLAASHGFRVSELVGLKREQLDLEGQILHVRRLKKGRPTTHPLSGKEVRALRQVLRDAKESQYVFVSEQGGPMDRRNFGLIVARAGELAGLPLAVHPHMLRHACGYKRANEGRDLREIQLYLGHRNVQHTVLYTELAEGVFKDWVD